MAQIPTRQRMQKGGGELPREHAATVRQLAHFLVAECMQLHAAATRYDVLADATATLAQHAQQGAGSESKPDLQHIAEDHQSRQLTQPLVATAAAVVAAPNVEEPAAFGAPAAPQRPEDDQPPAATMTQFEPVECSAAPRDAAEMFRGGHSQRDLDAVVGRYAGRSCYFCHPSLLTFHQPVLKAACVRCNGINAHSQRWRGLLILHFS